jgi:ABC-type multidrug transport system ATPase subunit
LYVLDQPGDGLDGEGLRCFTAAVRAVVAAGSTVILADAAPHLPASLCDRVGCIEKGAITAEVSRSEAEFGSRIAESQGWAV